MANIANLISQNLISIVFGLVGLIGTIITVASWVSSKKNNRTYDYLLKLAEKNIDKNISEEQLKQKKKDIADASGQILQLQEQINKALPIVAKRTVLKDRLYTETEQLEVLYKTVLKTKGELSSIDEDIQISPDLLKSVQAEISPTFLIKERQSTIKTALTIVTSAAAIISSLFHEWYIRDVIIALLSVGFILLVILIWQSIKMSSLYKSISKEFLRKAEAIIAIAIGIILMLFSIALGIVIIGDMAAGYRDSGFVLVGILFLILLGVAVLIFGIRKYRFSVSNKIK